MTNCGSGGSGSESCCTSLEVPGGTFYRYYDGVGAEWMEGADRNTVSTLRIDKYEVTVARFRQFVQAEANGWRPQAGSGKHTHLNGGNGLADVEDAGVPYETGWNSAWDVNLATTAADWDAKLSCNGLATWTSAPGPNDNRPINCMDWYDAYAFCIWDNGFLPSDAERAYVGAGGSDQRFLPWSTPPTSTTIDCSYANYSGGDAGSAPLDDGGWIPFADAEPPLPLGPSYCRAGGTDNVGSQPKGNGKWGHADLGGNVWEWVLDYTSDLGCVDCANTSVPFVSGASGSNPNVPNRGLQGGGLGGCTPPLRCSLEVDLTLPVVPSTQRMIEQGVRCARVP